MDCTADDDKHVRVFVRVRPTGQAEKRCLASSSHEEIALEKQPVLGLTGGNKRMQRKFRFQHIFDERATQVADK